MNMQKFVKSKEKLTAAGIPNWQSFMRCSTPQDVDGLTARAKDRIADMKARGVKPEIYANDERILEYAEKAREALQ